MSRFQRRSGEEPRVTPLELFYDLVFVFAITQVSHHLIEHLSWTGAGHLSSCCSWSGGRGTTRRG